MFNFQKLDIREGSVPDTTSELIVTGGSALKLGPHSLTLLKDLRHVSFSGIKLVLLQKNAAVEMNVVNAYLDINNCEVLKVEERTFNNIRGKWLFLTMATKRMFMNLH
jgi:hypothetical protein